MPKFLVTDQLNHGGQILGKDAEVDLPLHVAADPAVRGHIRATDDEGKLAFIAPDTTTGQNVLRAGAPLAEHELAEDDARLISEGRMYAERIKTIEAKLASNNARREELRRGNQARADTGAPAGPGASEPQPAVQGPVTGGAPVTSAPAGTADRGAPAGPAAPAGAESRPTGAEQRSGAQPPRPTEAEGGHR